MSTSIKSEKNLVFEVESSFSHNSTLSIIAYKQPVTKSEIEKIRGVNCDYTIQKLLAKELISIKTRQYIKRQFTWARGQMPNWTYIDTKKTSLTLKKILR